MPIVNLPPNPPLPESIPKQNVSVVAPSYKHSVVDTQVTPLQSLITHIEGSSWIGNHYSQVVASDEELSEFQPNQMTPYQQYHLIRDMESKIQGGLNFSTDSETGVLTVTGTVIYYPSIIPNRGDVWIADIGDGRAGQFTIISVEAKSYFQQTCYEAQLELARFVDPALIENINNRVVRTSYFKKDFLVYGQNPIIAEEAVVAFATLTQLETQMLNHWMQLFFSGEYNTFMVPGQEGPTYDPYVTRLMFSMYNTVDHPKFTRAKLLNVDGVAHVTQPCVFDALMKQDNTILDDAMRGCQLISTLVFNEHTLLKTIRYSGIHYVVGAKEIIQSVDTDYAYPNYIIGAAFKNLQDFDIDAASIAYNNVIGEFVYPGEEPLPPSSVYVDTEVPMLHAILATSTYIFSPDFYDNTPDGYSKLEHLVKEYLVNGNINRTVLYAVSNGFKTWGRLEKFYYIPVLLLLMKVAKLKV